jgi:hypothetical protein
MRNPKSEIRRPKEGRNPKAEIRRRGAFFASEWHWELDGTKTIAASKYGLRISDFGLLSAFGFRISGFGRAVPAFPR